MKLDWKTNDERCWCNVDEGQIIVSKGIHQRWVIDGIFLEWLSMRNSLRKALGDKEWESAGAAQNDVERWYLSTRKDATECSPAT